MPNSLCLFLRRTAFAVLLLLGCTLRLHAAPIPPECKVGDFAVGCQAYTFKLFTIFEAIEKTAQAGGRVIELHGGQMLSPEEPNVKFDHHISDETLRKLQDQLNRCHVRAVSYGVVYGKSETDWRQVFEFARKLGLYSITTETVKDLDLLEKLAREFDIRVAIHNHAQRPDAPDYKVWDPSYVLGLVKNRDPRIGVCPDTGHWATSGLQPLPGIKLLRGRIVSIHLKDRGQLGKATPDRVLGTGIADIRGILGELKQQNFAGPIILEYENNWTNSVPDVRQSIDFIRGCGASSSGK